MLALVFKEFRVLKEFKVLKDLMVLMVLVFKAYKVFKVFKVFKVNPLQASLVFKDRKVLNDLLEIQVEADLKVQQAELVV